MSRRVPQWQSTDAFRIANACLIILTVALSAITGWRASSASAAARQMDAQGLSAMLAAEESRAQTSAAVYQQLAAYSQYTRNKALGDALNTILETKYQGMRLPPNPAAAARINEVVRGLEQRRDEAYDMASANQYFFATRFLLPDGNFDAARQQQQAAQRATLDQIPALHFEAADQSRGRAASLAALLIVCALNVLLLALAMHLREGALASALLAAAMVLALLIAASIVAIEQDALRMMPNLPFLGGVLP